jgi:hypothetical protein
MGVFPFVENGYPKPTGIMPNQLQHLFNKKSFRHLLKWCPG